MTRRLVALGAAALLITGCSDAGEPPSTGGDRSEEVLASRAALGEPAVALAEAVIALGDGMAAARYEVPRGEDMKAPLQRLPALQQQVRDAARAASEATTDAPIERAAAIVAAAAEQAETAAAAAAAEIEFLNRLAAIDVALLDAAAEWDRPGSQSEIRTRLDAVAGSVGQLRRRLEKVRPAPRQCAVMKRNRAQWISTVRERTRQLQAQANSAGGTTFDRLRSSYRGLPLAVEPRTADRTDRRCWAGASDVAGAEQQLRQAVASLEEELSG